MVAGNGPSALEAIGRFNGIMGSVYSVDKGLRVVTYGAALASVYLAKESSKNQAFLAAFASRIGDARFVSRFFSWPTMWSVLTDKSDSSTLGQIDTGMKWSMLAFYPLEHGWWLSTVEPNVLPYVGPKWSMWSCRAWGVYVVLDLIKAFILIKKAIKELARRSGSSPSVDEDENKGAKKQLRWQITKLRMHMTCALSDLVMAIHWGAEQSPFNGNFVNLMGLYGGIAGMWIKWRDAGMSA